MKISFLNKLGYLLTKKDKRMIVVLLFMSLLLSLIETIGIAAIMPFISTASNPDLIFSNQYYNRVYNLFDFKNTNNFIISFGLVLIFFYIFRGLYTILHGYLMTKFALGKYSYFAVKLFENYIHLPYLEFVNRNSATMNKVIVAEASQLSFLLQSVLTFLSETIIIIILYTLLLLVNVKMTLLLTLLISLKVLLLSKTISKKIKVKGAERAVVEDKFYRMINQSLGNFKSIKVLSNQAELIDKFSHTSKRFADIHIVNNTLQLIPRNILEVVGLSSLMGIVIYIVMFSNNISSIIPTISMYALALYRILPAVTKIINSYNGIVFYTASLNIVYDNIAYKYEKEGSEEISFLNKIELNNVSFSYKPNKKIIDNLSLSIKRGEKVAFIGESGSGKSTLVDIICGIYKPSEGEIFIDDIKLNTSNIVSWRKKIGYIPQDIYLFDGTVTENILFGREYDEELLINVLKQTNIFNFIMEKEGLATKVGDGGIQLSGGQKQRIGIARALYGNPEVLVLDEATSALDNETESNIMNEIYKVSSDKTLLIIAHRLSTIEKCNIKINLDKIRK